MTDVHLRILRLVARRRRRELTDHDAVDHVSRPASARHRRDLERSAGRADANVAAAEARRRDPRAAGRAG
jgi:hypothetical protein